MQALVELMSKLQCRAVVEAVLNELSSATEKHPEWPRDVIHAAAIVGEESGELTRAALQYEYEDGDLENCQKEAIQTAAMAIRFLMNLGRYR